MRSDNSTMASRTVGAGMWTVGTRLVAKLIDLVMLICLARFLGPAEFGLVAMAMAAVFVVEALFELPMAAALIRVSTVTQDMLHTAFTLSLLRGLGIAVLFAAISLPLAKFNDEPRLTALLCVLALAPAMRGLVSPRMAEFARAFNFRPDALIELSGKVAACTVSVAIAVGTGSYWAIAAATVCGPLVTTLLSYCVAPLRPRFRLTHWSHFSNLIGWNFMSQLSSALNWQIDRLLLPRLTTTAVFGQYAMGKQISEIPLQALIQPLVRPTIAALGAASDSRGPRYAQLSHAVALVMIPVIGAQFLWPEVLLRLALGPAWLPAAEWLRWISAVAFLGLPAILMGPLAMTMDRTRWMAVRSLIELLIRLPLVSLGAMQFGILGAIAGSAIATAFGTLTALLIVRRLTHIGAWLQLKVFWTPMAAFIPAGAVLYLSQPIVMEAATLPALVALALGFGSLYVALYLLLTASAWWLTGRQPGLEHFLLRYIRSRSRASESSNKYSEFGANGTGRLP